MVKHFYFYGKYLFGGVLSYAAPRFLVAVGVPLDRWIVLAANLASIAISNDAALWGAGTVFCILLFVALFVLDRRHRILPSASTTTDIAERDTKADRALAFIETGTWLHQTYNEYMGSVYDGKGSSFNQFQQAALDGKFRVWGKTGPHSLYGLIDKDYWNDWKLEVMSCMMDVCKTEIIAGTPRIGTRYDLMVSRIEIEKIWPPKK